MIEAYVLVRVQPARLDEASNIMRKIKDEIRKIKGVMEVHGVFGRYDFVARIEADASSQSGNLVTETIRTWKE
jgi:DNA-binding Lrp family transcriptional regulator